MCRRRRPEVRKQISLLVPYAPSDTTRIADWEWLRAYWQTFLPDAEIVIGRDRKSERKWWRRKRHPFSKTAALNHAFRRSHGDIIVLLDADAYLKADVIQHCAARLRLARFLKVRVWFVPYQRLFRLTENATADLLWSLPYDPWRFPDPPPEWMVESNAGSGHGYRFGALCQIMPREAVEELGGFPERFRGWGGEDSSILRALDTLWGHYKTTPNSIFHLWHAKNIAHEDWVDPRGKTWEIRAWDNQGGTRVNDHISRRYAAATGDPVKMRALLDEDRGIKKGRKR